MPPSDLERVLDLDALGQGLPGVTLISTDAGWQTLEEVPERLLGIRFQMSGIEIGFAYVTRGSDVRIEELIVHPPFQGRGHGARLATALVEGARSAGHRVVRVTAEGSDLYPGAVGGYFWAVRGFDWADVQSRAAAQRLLRQNLHLAHEGGAEHDEVRLLADGLLNDELVTPKMIADLGRGRGTNSLRLAFPFGKWVMLKLTWEAVNRHD